MAARIVELMELTSEDAAIEIGPGTGQLTRPVAKVARRTIAIELDRGLAELLRASDLPESVEIRHEDALKADLGGLARELGPPVVLLGNLPYNISGRLLGALLSPNNPFRRWGFMLQREVADRVLAGPGEPGYGTLSIWALLFSRARRVLDLSPDQFEPRPRVRSAFVVFDPPAAHPSVASPSTLRKLVRGAFQQRRKTLRRALKRDFPGIEAALSELGLDPKCRGETLAPEEFVALANAVQEQRETA